MVALAPDTLAPLPYWSRQHPSNLFGGNLYPVHLAPVLCAIGKIGEIAVRIDLVWDTHAWVAGFAPGGPDVFAQGASQDEAIIRLGVALQHEAKHAGGFDKIPRRPNVVLYGRMRKKVRCWWYGHHYRIIRVGDGQIASHAACDRCGRSVALHLAPAINK